MNYFTSQCESLRVGFEIGTFRSRAKESYSSRLLANLFEIWLILALNKLIHVFKLACHTRYGSGN